MIETKRFPSIKLKDKAGKNAFEIRDPAGVPMLIQAIRILKDPRSATRIAVEIDFVSSASVAHTE